MQILIAGATGFLGKPLCGELLRGGHSIVAVSRDPERASQILPRGIHSVPWSTDALCENVAAADAVVNLAGESVAAHRWTPAFKERLRSSRVDTTRSIVSAMHSGGRTNQILLNASAVGYYGDAGDNEVTESAPPGTGYLAELCVEWEAEARKAEEFGARVALARLGPVLAEEGSLLDRLLPIFRLGLGGPLGSGRQWFPWIHRADAIRLLTRMLEDNTASGPVNVTAPEPVTNAGFARALGRALRRPAVIPAPAFAIRLALGEFADSVLTGQKALPRAAERMGFAWKYPTIELALKNAIRGEEDE